MEIVQNGYTSKTVFLPFPVFDNGYLKLGGGFHLFSKSFILTVSSITCDELK